jgi:hypothetical protein
LAKWQSSNLVFSPFGLENLDLHFTHVEHGEWYDFKVVECKGLFLGDIEEFRCFDVDNDLRDYVPFLHESVAFEPTLWLLAIEYFLVVEDRLFSWGLDEDYKVVP